MFKTIIHPTDLSKASIAAHKAAHSLAKALGSKLLVCYIAQPPLVASGNELTDPQTGKTRYIVEEVQAIQPPDPAVNCEVKILMAQDAADSKTLLSLLEKMGGDLIVLGMHKRAGVKGWMGGSITEEVVRQAKAAVLVVKHYDQEP